MPQDSVNRYPVSYAAEPPPIDATRSHATSTAATTSAARPSTSVAAAPSSVAVPQDRRETSPYDTSSSWTAASQSVSSQMDSAGGIGGLSSMVHDSSGSKSAVSKVCFFLFLLESTAKMVTSSRQIFTQAKSSTKSKENLPQTHSKPGTELSQQCCEFA